MKTLLIILLVISGATWAEDELSQPEMEYQTEAEREPAALSPFATVTTKRNYPGGADEEDLRVQTTLPEALLKTDSRSVQREVYKNLFNQELKEERVDTVEE